MSVADFRGYKILLFPSEKKYVGLRVCASVYSIYRGKRRRKGGLSSNLAEKEDVLFPILIRRISDPDRRIFGSISRVLPPLLKS